MQAPIRVSRMSTHVSVTLTHTDTPALKESFGKNALFYLEKKCNRRLSLNIHFNSKHSLKRAPTTPTCTDSSAVIIQFVSTSCAAVFYTLKPFHSRLLDSSQRNLMAFDLNAGSAPLSV